MNREKAIEIFKRLKENAPNEMHLETVGTAQELFEMAIQALSQEPCDDLISRKAVDKYIARLLSGYLYDGERERLEIFSAYLWELPSVTQKSGKWINDKNDMPICSRCGYIPQFDRAIDDYEYSNYCPSCGCRMVEPQERSE